MSAPGVEVLDDPLDRESVRLGDLREGLEAGGFAPRATPEVPGCEDPSRAGMEGECGRDGHLRREGNGHQSILYNAVRMKVSLLFFAVLRDIAGRDRDELDLPDGARPRDVWEQLRARYRELGDYREPPMTAVNEEYVPPDTPLRDGDELAFIPPVAGG